MDGCLRWLKRELCLRAPLTWSFVVCVCGVCSSELIQVPVNPVDGGHATRLSSVAFFLLQRVYDRLPADLQSSPLHFALNTQVSIRRRWCAAPQPHWFLVRLQFLLEQRTLELDRQEAVEEAQDADAAEEDG